MQMLSVDQLVGRTLGEYRIDRLLGHGQLGAAYMAQQLSHARTAIITTFNFPEGISAQERAQFSVRFAQEGAVLTRLTHPNILPIYDFGEQSGFPYLVTAFVKGASLSQILKQQVRFTPEQTLDVLKQLASGLDYAHSNGVAHGILGLSNVLMSDELIVQIAGFGMKALLEVHGNTQNRPPQAHLFSANRTFLGNPEYISPERVLGMPADARSDIYALGVILFELLSGTPPFDGANPLDIAVKRLQRPVPSVHAVCPDVPGALDLVISRALEREPANRYQCAGDIAIAFERVLKVLETTQRTIDASTQQLARDPQITLPPTVNWFDEPGISSGKWQLMPPIVTGHMPAVTSSSSEKTAREGADSLQMELPGVATQPDAPADMFLTKEKLPSPAGSRPDSMAGVDPFAWWSSTSADLKTPPPSPGTFTRRSPVRLASSNPRSRRHPAQQDRRKLVSLIATGTVTAGVLAVGGISFARFIQSMKQSQSQIANVPTTGSTSSGTSTGNAPTTGSTTAGPTKGTQNTPAPSKSPTAKPSSSPSPSASPTQGSQQTPTPQPTPKPTQPPQPTPTPPSHTGTVIGHTNMSNNSSVSFTNPADGKGSLLIRLPSGNFVACERACTHVGVPVNYDSGSHQLVCPAHGAVFNPSGGFSLVSGPGNGPLASVSIRVNADGTITTG